MHTPKIIGPKWSLLRPVSDLSASCGLQGPGPRGRTEPPARSRCPHDRAPGESWQEKTLCCTDHFVRRRFRTPPPCAQMLTSCKNSEPPNAQTAPIIIPPSSERGWGAPPRDPPSLTGWFWHANCSSSLSLASFGTQIALHLSHWPKRAASSLIGPGAW